MKCLRSLYVCAAFALLAGCSSLGLAPAQSPSQAIAYAYGSVAAVRTTAAQELTAGQITAVQAQTVLTLTDKARTSLDAAEAVVLTVGSGTATADQANTIANDLAIATSVLQQVQAMLPSTPIK